MSPPTGSLPEAQSAAHPIPVVILLYRPAGNVLSHLGFMMLTVFLMTAHALML